MSKFSRPTYGPQMGNNPSPYGITPEMEMANNIRGASDTKISQKEIDRALKEGYSIKGGSKQFKGKADQALYDKAAKTVTDQWRKDHPELKQKGKSGTSVTPGTPGPITKSKPPRGGHGKPRTKPSATPNLGSPGGGKPKPGINPRVGPRGKPAPGGGHPKPQPNPTVGAAPPPGRIARGDNRPTGVGKRGSAGKGVGRGYGGTLADSPGYKARYGDALVVAKKGGYAPGEKVQFYPGQGPKPKPGPGPTPDPLPNPTPKPKPGPTSGGTPRIGPPARIKPPAPGNINPGVLPSVGGKVGPGGGTPRIGPPSSIKPQPVPGITPKPTSSASAPKVPGLPVSKR